MVEEEFAAGPIEINSAEQNRGLLPGLELLISGKVPSNKKAIKGHVFISHRKLDGIGNGTR